MQSSINSLRRPAALTPKLRYLGLVFFSLLVGCGIGSGGNDAGSGTGADGGTGTPADELAIEITGQTKYRADEGVSLS